MMTRIALRTYSSMFHLCSKSLAFLSSVNLTGFHSFPFPSLFGLSPQWCARAKWCVSRKQQQHKQKKKRREKRFVHTSFHCSFLDAQPSNRPGAKEILAEGTRCLREEGTIRKRRYLFQRDTDPRRTIEGRARTTTERLSSNNTKKHTL